MFGKRKRLAKVVVTLRHGESLGEPTRDYVEEITIYPGQSFHKHIGYSEIREHGQTIRTLDWRAGFTEDVEYFYQ